MPYIKCILINRSSIHNSLPHDIHVCVELYLARAVKECVVILDVGTQLCLQTQTVTLLATVRLPQSH